MTREIKQLLGVIGIVVVGFVIWHFQGDVYNVDQPVRDDYFGFELKVPRSWEVANDLVPDEEMFADVAVAIQAPARGPRFRHCAIVAVHELEEPVVADDQLVPLFLEDAELVGAFEMEEEGPAIIAGTDARWAEYVIHLNTGAGPAVKLKYLTYLIPRGTRLYMVSCAAHVAYFDDERRVFEKICESFEFTDA